MMFSVLCRSNRILNTFEEGWGVECQNTHNQGVGNYLLSIHVSNSATSLVAWANMHYLQDKEGYAKIGANSSYEGSKR